MIDYSEISYAEINDCIQDAKEGLLSPYWQRYAEREFNSLRVFDGTLPKRAQVLYERLKLLLLEIEQCEDELDEIEK